MSRTLRVVVTAYRLSLRLYPAEFRGAYGGEMADVFEQQLTLEFASRGLPGVLATLGLALHELLTIALPEWLIREQMIAPSLSLVITSAVLACLEAWLHHKFLFFGRIH
jgi:hypothetical protein